MGIAAFENTTSPIPIDKFAPRLDNMVEQCSSNETYPEFCVLCTSRVQDAITQTFYSDVDFSDLIHVDTEFEENALLERVGEQALDYLHDQGVPDDAFFQHNVIECLLYSSRDACIGNTALMDALDSHFLVQCKELVIDLVAIDRSGDQEPILEQKVEYCQNCYWPMIKVLVNQAGMPDSFWCDYKNFTLGDSTLPDPEHLATIAHLLHSSPVFNACIENVRGKLRSIDPRLDLFSSSLTRDIRQTCWFNDDAMPEPGAMLDEATEHMVSTLMCDN